MKTLLLAFLVTLSACACYAGTPTVSNVTASQQPNSEIVQITYNLLESENLPCWIFVFVDRDN